MTELTEANASDAGAFDAEAHARRVAAIVGPLSAAAKAIDNLDSRRDAGEHVSIFKVNGVWVVG